MQGIVEWTLSLAETAYANGALFAVAFAESSFFIVPPDLLQIALSVAAPDKSYLYAGISLVGSVTGGMLGYAIGRYGGRPLLNRFISKDKINFVERAFQKYDAWAIGIAGFTPLPYKIFTISAGAFRLDFKRFILVSILSRGARFFLVATLFYFFGESIRDTVLKHVNLFSVIFVALLIGGFVFVSFLSRRRGKTS